MTGSTWTWELRDRAIDQFDALDADLQGRIADKLDDIVTDEWRDPHEYVEPLQGVPHGKIRVGEYRLGARASSDTQTLAIFSIEHRSGADTADDD